MTDTGSSKRHLAWAAILVLVLVPFALIEGPGARILSRLGLTDEGESFTELYFTDHRALPQRLPVGAPLVFDFSVHNREGADQTYTWQVVVEPQTSGSTAAEPLVVDRGELGLADDEVAVIHIDRTTPVPTGSAVVRVALVERNESIDFPITFVAESDAGSP